MNQHGRQKYFILSDVISEHRIGSKFSNCLTFDQRSSGTIFLLKWSKRRFPLLEQNTISSEDSNYFKDLAGGLSSVSTSIYKEAILGYIAGFIVRKLYSKITSDLCQ